ncbi:EAL domain-containing protein [Vibrio paucivorans]
MKLNTRILLLVAPVIALSAAMSSYTIYASQKDALLKREDSYLQLSMEKLAGHFRQAVTSLNSYAFTLTKSDIIRHYIYNEGNSYRSLELIANLQSTLSTLQAGEQKFTGLAILDGNKEPQYYADTSSDPFAQLDPKILAYTKEIFNTTGRTSHTGYTQNSQGAGVLVRYEALDKNTLSSPLSYNRNDIFFVVVCVSLEQFNQLRKKIEFDNKSTIFFTEEPLPKKTALTQTVELQSGFYATLDPARFLIQAKVQAIGKNLAIAFGLSSLFTVLILLFLLYRHVISPISKLDKQLKQVENNQRKNIEILYSEDEIAHLSRRFYDMYNELDTTYQKTKALAENDHLTQLANRHQFQQYVERALINTFATKQAWILYIDLDNFKYVNDKYGHQAGDHLLISFANHVQALTSEFEENHQIKCLASRLSGDEFAIFVSSKHYENENHVIEQFARQLLDPIQNNSISPLGNLPITASVGIATFPEDGHKVNKLISNADTAMYQAKRAGKNQIAHYSKDLDLVIQRRTQVERALRNGNFDQEFELLYQPYFDKSACTVVGVEALLRWNSVKLGDVSPSEFIPIAEQTGLFGKIDRWVIKTAFADFTSIQSQFNSPIQLSINLSSAELDSLQLANYIQQQAVLSNVKPHLIDFEITETFASDSQSFPLLHELSLQGYKLAIDDFGSGYTSITQLVEYPVQKIKLDRYFLETLIKTNNQKVIKPLVELCHSQSMVVTAEGIESAEMYYWLSEYNCDYMQGFYFGEPLKVHQLYQLHNIERQGTQDVSKESRHSFA